MNRFRSIVLAAAFAGVVSVSAASAQSISVVSGNGQVLSVSDLLLQPLVVIVKDTNGNPQSGQAVNWNASGSNGVYGFFLATGTNQATTVTDTTGQTTVYGNIFGNLLGSSSFLTSIAQTYVSAALANGNAVNFTLTQVLSSGTATGVVAEAFVSLTDPTGNQTTFSGQIFSGAVGTTYSQQTIQVHAYATNGQATSAIPYAAVQLLNYQNPATGPAVACVETDPTAGFGTILTDANGNGTCTVAFGGQPGNGQFVVALGGVASATVTPAGYWQISPTDDVNPTPVEAAADSPTLNETVTAGTPGSMTITQGNNQTATAGTALTTQLQVQVKSTGGQPLSGQTVNWTESPANSAVLSIPSPTTDFNGLAYANVTLAGGDSGTVKITATVAGSSISQTFTITAVPLAPPVTITGFNIVSGNNQTTPVSTAFPQPLVVGVTVSAGSPAGITVQFSASGSVSLSATSATTDSNGHAQVNVTAGSVLGPATVTATIAGVGTLTFQLTVSPPAPLITAGNFLNGADLQPNSLSPCGLGALVAGSLGAASVGPAFPGLPLPNSNVNITFSNIAAPILNIGTTASGQQQITFQVPCTVTPSSSVPVVVAVGPGSTPVNVAVNAVSPGIFQTLMSDGVFRAVLVRPDGSYVSLQNPARRGETEIAFVTGLGATSPPVGTQALPVPGTTATVQGTVVPGMAGQGVPLVYARLSEDLPGVYLVAFQIPASMTTGNNVNFSIGIQASGSSTTTYSGLSTIPVQ